jgi:hypothetical protein
MTRRLQRQLLHNSITVEADGNEDLNAMMEWYSQPVSDPEQGKALERLSFLKPQQLDILALMAHGQTFEEIQSVLDLPRRDLRLKMTQLMNQLEIRDSSPESIQYYYDLAQWGGWLD